MLLNNYIAKIFNAAINDPSDSKAPIVGVLQWLNEVLSIDIAKLALDDSTREAIRTQMQVLAKEEQVDPKINTLELLRRYASKGIMDNIRIEALKVICKVEDKEAYPLVLESLKDSSNSQQLRNQALITLYGLDPSFKENSTREIFEALINDSPDLYSSLGIILNSSLSASKVSRDTELSNFLKPMLDKLQSNTQ